MQRSLASPVCLCVGAFRTRKLLLVGRHDCSTVLCLPGARHSLLILLPSNRNRQRHLLALCHSVMVALLVFFSRRGESAMQNECVRVCACVCVRACVPMCVRVSVSVCFWDEENKRSCARVEGYLVCCMAELASRVRAKRRESNPTRPKTHIVRIQHSKELTTASAEPAKGNKQASKGQCQEQQTTVASTVGSERKGSTRLKGQGSCLKACSFSSFCESA